MTRCSTFNLRYLIGALLLTAIWALPASADEAQFERDIKALTAAPHRLAGSPQGRAAGDYITNRLRDMGIKDVFEQSMDSWYTDVEECEIDIDGTKLPLLPMRSNLVVPPCTPAEGISGRMFYVGKGELADYGSRDPKGAIVVFDYNSEDNWKRAFAMGASAVLFLTDNEQLTPTEQLRQIHLPVNLVRLYVPRATASKFDFTKDHAKVTLHSKVIWKQGTGRNIIAFLPGTDPTMGIDPDKSEAVVISAYYDSFGQVPQDSPGARGSANVAALLEATEQFKAKPTRRNLFICFFDAHAQGRQGAREFYHQLLSTKSEIGNLADAHQAESQFNEKILAALAPTEPRLESKDKDVLAAAKTALQRQAEFLREDLNMQARRLRLAGQKDSQQYTDYRELVKQWDDVRRKLGSNKMEDISQSLYAQLRTSTLAYYQQRESELRQLLADDAQWKAFRERVGLENVPYVSLHVSYEFSDATNRWGVMVSDSTMQLLARTNNTADSPGLYTTILGALRQSAAAAGLNTNNADPVHLETTTLEDPLAGQRYCASPLLTDGYVAGYSGIYNIALITSADAKVRDAQPTDTPALLNWRNLRAQALQATRLIAAAADNASLTQPRVFQQLVHQSDPTWSADRMEPGGNFIGAQVTGGLREQRPASKTMVMIFPAFNRSEPFSNFEKYYTLRGVQPAATTTTDMHGHYAMTWLRSDFYGGFGVLAVQFDSQGLITSVPNDQSIIQQTTALARTDIFQGHGQVTLFPSLSSVTTTVQNLRAVSDATLRNTLNLHGQSNTAQASFFYSADIVGNNVFYKVVQPTGPVLLNNSPAVPQGNGYSLRQLQSDLPVDAVTAQNLWQLNESRLRILRKRGVVDVNLESIHDEAKRLLPSMTSDDAGQPLQADQSAGATAADQPLSDLLSRWTESTARSRHVYQPVRDAMNDLVHAVVVLLLLAIPFAFSLERLLIGASSIYKRLGGFIVIFLITFGLLYWLHPGFAIATTPIIIFLAFAIILLSSLVIFIVLRKFHTELNRMHGHGDSGGGRHALTVSRTGTLIAAINMGMSTMRRRPLRTWLTALTVVILTFTILCFASVGRELGIRSVYLGPAPLANHEAILIHQLDFSPIVDGAINVATARSGPQGLVAAQWWLVRQTGDSPFAVSRPVATPGGSSADTPVLFVDAVMGLDPAEMQHWAAMVAALSASNPSADHVADQLQRGGVYLPQLIANQLKLQPGDNLLLDGRPAFFAGSFDADALQRMKNIDGESMLPVDFQDPALQEFRKQQQQSKQDETPDMNVQRNFIRLSPAQVAVTGAQFTRSAGGELSIIKIYPAEQTDSAELAANLTTDLPLPVWARSSSGVQRMIFTTLTHLSGGLALFIPLILGGLIIFGTMLGSIADRQKEIYTFSALGLAPAHVGLLFFAEASVYAIVGGMGGQLLAQAVAKIASVLAQAGLIAPPAINFSSTNAMFAIMIVMATVLISAIYPASRASRSANPGVQRHWKMPAPVNDRMSMTFPFTVSAYDITGVISFLAEHFREHDDAGLGLFAVQSVSIQRDEQTHNLVLSAQMALAPFDLGVTQEFQLTAKPSEIPGIDEILVAAARHSGSRGDWQRALRVFIADLRKQFLLWRTVSPEVVEQYRVKTLMELGEKTAGQGNENSSSNPKPGVGDSSVNRSTTEGRA